MLRNPEPELKWNLRNKIEISEFSNERNGIENWNFKPWSKSQSSSPLAFLGLAIFILKSDFSN